MDTAQKVRENRARRAATRQGLELQRHRSRDTRHMLYGTYQVVRSDGTVLAAKRHPMFGFRYGLSIGEAEEALRGKTTNTERAN